MPEPSETEYTVQGQKGSTISSVRISLRGGHAHITVWTHGMNVGTLVVDARDADDLVNRLTGMRRTSWERLNDPLGV